MKNRDEVQAALSEIRKVLDTFSEDDQVRILRAVAALADIELTPRRYGH